MKDPTPPTGLQELPGIVGAERMAAWLLNVARKYGEPAIDRALASWPGTVEQRRLLHPSHIQRARDEARQIGNETWAKEAKARGKWGV